MGAARREKSSESLLLNMPADSEIQTTEWAFIQQTSLTGTGPSPAAKLAAANVTVTLAGNHGQAALVAPPFYAHMCVGAPTLISTASRAMMQVTRAPEWARATGGRAGRGRTTPAPTTARRSPSPR